MEMIDILIHVHPDLPPETRAKVEEDIGGRDGVVSAHFIHKEHSHAMEVAFDLDTIHASQILEAVKHYDPAATMIGL